MLSVGNIIEDNRDRIDGEGLDVTDPGLRKQALRRYNQATAELMREDNWANCTVRIRKTLTSGQFWLPPCVDRVIHAQIDGHPSPIRPDSWEFVMNGPGGYEGGHEVRDLGEHSTAVDVPGSMQLTAWSDQAEAPSAWVHFTSAGDQPWVAIPGYDVYPGEKITIARGEGSGAVAANVTASSWLTPRSIRKSVTNGTVKVCAKTTEGGVIWLASLSPNEQQSRYRRYSVATAASGTLVATCQLRYVPAVHYDEIALIQNSEAMGYMFRALACEDINQMTAWKMKAVSQLDKELQRYLDGQTHKPSFDPNYGGCRIRSFHR